MYKIYYDIVLHGIKKRVSVTADSMDSLNWTIHKIIDMGNEFVCIELVEK